jgi:hypothetical protein
MSPTVASMATITLDGEEVDAIVVRIRAFATAVREAFRAIGEAFLEVAREFIRTFRQLEKLVSAYQSTLATGVRYPTSGGVFPRRGRRR